MIEVAQRLLTGITLIALLSFFIYLEQIKILVILIQIKVFHELSQLHFTSCKKQPYSDWALFSIALIFSLYPNLYSFLGYTTWFMLWTGFILGKVPDKDLNGILLHTFWIHIASCLTTLQPYFIQHNLSRGLFWFPCSTVIVNDTAAYFFGRWFGQIPLFSKSPRKTLEGYLAAIPLTLLFGYTVSGWLRVSTSDGVIIALFAAIVAPFGGFFASSLKRANNIKDFGTFLPGHGGLADRVDCQLFMAAFTYFLCSQCEEDS